MGLNRRSCAAFMAVLGMDILASASDAFGFGFIHRIAAEVVLLKAVLFNEMNAAQNSNQKIHSSKIAAIEARMIHSDDE